MFTALKKLFTRSELTALTQRRRQRRFSCFVPVMCTCEGQTESGMIVDLATGGLRLMIRQRVKPGAVLQLHYNAGSDKDAVAPPVAARVMWSRRNGEFWEVGVLCAEGQLFWVPALLRSLAVGPDYTEVRRTVRFNGDLSASLSVHFGPSYVSAFINGQLTDLSLGGAAFCGPVKAPVGTTVQLSIQPAKGRSLTLQGRVVRQSRRTDGRTLHGIRFESLTDSLKGDLSRILLGLRDGV